MLEPSLRRYILQDTVKIKPRDRSLIILPAGSIVEATEPPDLTEYKYVMVLLRLISPPDDHPELEPGERLLQDDFQTSIDAEAWSKVSKALLPEADLT